jgi:aspartate aminotransferase
MTRLSHKVRSIAPSMTVAVTQRAAELRARGVDVVGFGAGEPDFDTPLHIKQAAQAALEKGATKYTNVAGTAELRAAAAAELSRIHGVSLAPEQVIVSVGAKHSLYNLLQALIDPEDEVVIPAPCWVSYPELVQMAGGTPVILETRADEGFRIDEHELAKLVTRRTRAVILCSPCNPTGAIYDARTLEGVARVVSEHAAEGSFVITDDIYRRLVYRGEWVSFARVAPELAERIIFVDGVSKTYAMTGWRIGFCAGPRDLIGAMATLQSQSTTNPASVSQAAALAALTGPQDMVETMRLEFDRRRRTMVERLRAIPRVKLVEPDGAFYCFPDLSAFVGGEVKDDLQLCERLLDRGKVAIVPGSGFLAPGFARLSYATSMAQIEKGIDRLAAALGEIG